MASELKNRVLVADRVLDSMTIGPCLWITLCLREMGYTSLNQAKPFFANRMANLIRKALRMTGEREDNRQPCERLMNRVTEEKVWGDVTGRGHKINKTGLKQHYLQNSHVSKEVPTKHHSGEMSQSFPWNSAFWGASLKCLCTNTCSMGNKQNALEICVQL